MLTKINDCLRCHRPASLCLCVGLIGAWTLVTWPMVHALEETEHSTHLPKGNMTLPSIAFGSASGVSVTASASVTYNISAPLTVLVSDTILDAEYDATPAAGPSEGVLAAMLVLIGGQIMYLVTRPEFRRLGLSRQLIAHVQARKQELLAKVRPTNQPILNTLLRMGFERARTYDDPPWDAYLWKKSASVRAIAHSKSSPPLV